MLPVALAIFSTQKTILKGFAVTFATLLILELAVNMTGFGEILWWSPLHWPSTIALGVDEIVENHGTAVTTIGYIVDLLIWSILITGIIQIIKKKKVNDNPSDGLPKPFA